MCPLTYSQIQQNPIRSQMSCSKQCRKFIQKTELYNENQDSREDIRAIVDRQLNVSCQWDAVAKRLIGKAEIRHWISLIRIREIQYWNAIHNSYTLTFKTNGAKFNHLHRNQWRATKNPMWMTVFLKLLKRRLSAWKNKMEMCADYSVAVFLREANSRGQQVP